MYSFSFSCKVSQYPGNVVQLIIKSFLFSCRPKLISWLAIFSISVGLYFQSGVDGVLTTTNIISFSNANFKEGDAGQDFFFSGDSAILLIHKIIFF